MEELRNVNEETELDVVEEETGESSGGILTKLLVAGAAIGGTYLVGKGIKHVKRFGFPGTKKHKKKVACWKDFQATWDEGGYDDEFYDADYEEVDNEEEEK